MIVIKINYMFYINVMWKFNFYLKVKKKKKDGLNKNIMIILW